MVCVSDHAEPLSAPFYPTMPMSPATARRPQLQVFFKTAPIIRLRGRSAMHGSTPSRFTHFARASQLAPPRLQAAHRSAPTMAVATATHRSRRHSEQSPLEPAVGGGPRQGTVPLGRRVQAGILVFDARNESGTATPPKFAASAAAGPAVARSFRDCFPVDCSSGAIGAAPAVRLRSI